MSPEVKRRLRDVELLARTALAVGLTAVAGCFIDIKNTNAMLPPAAEVNIGKVGDHHLAPSIPSFGYDTNQIWVPDTNQAVTEAAAVAAAGADEIRILTPYTVGGVEIDNDLQRYCNALYATEKYGLKLEIGLDGHFRDGSWGYFPVQANEKQRLHTDLFNLMSHLAGGSCHDPEGNVVKAQEIDLGFNEPNYKQRYKQPGMGKNLANLLVYLAPLLRQDAQKLNIKFNLTAAAITLSEPNDPISFIKEFDAQLNSLLRPGDPLPFDNVELNYYAFGQFTSDNLNSPSQATSIGKAVSELRSDFGQALPIGISELGAFSSTPSSKESLYTNPVPKAVQTFPGNSQGAFYERVIDLAACLHLNEVEIFHQSDDGNDVLRTGDHFPDGTPKPSARIVQRAFNNLDSGSISC